MPGVEINGIPSSNTSFVEQRHEIEHLTAPAPSAGAVFGSRKHHAPQAVLRDPINP
jgi:hypothetical protein